MNTLRDTLTKIANAFCDSILAEIRSASLEDLIEETGSAPRRAKDTQAARPPTAAPAHRAKIVDGKLARRSAEDLEKTLGLVTAALKAGPMRAEEIQAFLKLHRRELPAVLKLGIKKKRIRSKGQRRGTVYSVA
jgi:hypothetical protein